MILFSGISMGGDTGYKPLPSHTLHIFLAPALFSWFSPLSPSWIAEYLALLLNFSCFLPFLPLFPLPPQIQSRGTQ